MLPQAGARARSPYFRHHRFAGRHTLWDESESGARWDAPVTTASLLDGLVQLGASPRGTALLGLTGKPPKMRWMLSLGPVK
jgi:hypothetical protein